MKVGAPSRVAAPAPDHASSGATQGLRRTALLLHALSAADREWLLGRLGEPERRALRALQAELIELGIPAERSLVDEVLGGAERPSVAGDESPGRAGSALARAGAAEVGRVIDGEPPLVVAHLLSAGDWAWRAELLARMGGVARVQIESHLARLSAPRAEASSAEGAALREAIVAAVERRLTAGAAPPRREARSGLLGWLPRSGRRA